MKERPILFSGAMVRAILAGTKTQTRRPVKYTPALGDPAEWPADMTSERLAAFWLRSCPFGEPGDRLWVRETWASIGEPRDHRLELVAYRTDVLGGDRVRVDAPWRPSNHMPRWASRLSLDVTTTGIERLQSITEEGAEAEGFMRRLHFLEAFEDIYGPGDPWVWVVGFKRAT